MEPYSSIRTSAAMSANGCQTCFTQKAKCEREDPQAPCNRCTRAGRECVPRENVLDRRRKRELESEPVPAKQPARNAAVPVTAKKERQLVVRAAPAKRRRNSSAASNSPKPTTDGGLELSAGNQDAVPNNTAQEVSLLAPTGNKLPAVSAAYMPDFSENRVYPIPITSSQGSTHHLPSLDSQELLGLPSSAVSVPSFVERLPHTGANDGSFLVSLGSDEFAEPTGSVLPVAAIPGSGKHEEFNLYGLLQPCLTAYWGFVNPSNPIVHRASFEAAIAGQGGYDGPFGASPPYSLLFAIAGAGAAAAVDELPFLSDVQRARLARAYCAMAKELLLSSHVDKAPGVPGRMTDLEAALTLYICYMTVAASGQVKGGLIAVQYASAVLAGLAGDPASPYFVLGPSGFPRTATEWIKNEMVQRCWILLASADLAMSYWGGRETFLNYFPLRPIPLPAHEAFFDDMDPETAFRKLPCVMDGQHIWPSVDFGPFLRTPNVPMAADLSRLCVEPVFSHRASVLTLTLHNTFLRELRRKQSIWLKYVGLDTVGMMTKIPTIYTAAERQYRDGVIVFDAFIDAALASMPKEIGDSFIAGDSGPFFAKWNSYFANAAQAHYAATILMSLRTLPTEHYLRQEQATSDPSLFSSPEFLRILESSILYSRLLDGKMEADPDLRWAHHFHVAPGSRAGALLLAVIKSLNNVGGTRWVTGDSTGLINDARAIWRLLEAAGRRVGISIKVLAEDYKQQMLAADIPLEDRRLVDADGEVDEAPALRFLLDGSAEQLHDPSKVFMNTVVSADQAARNFYRSHTSV